ncbi:AAA family ATPase [Paraclostridium bifermentans]|uniref:AAA family ATPase n=1 Tax=Paraclostridium bifermentans TaxID=1490 RepID=UPI0018A9AF49|nr:AAA family ATPase [Paraclostridium bifermentans]
MYKIRIKNLRSLKDTKELEIKPLTIVVGRNSSGKSTLLRFFPLMKQTLETRRNEPILWYSNSYVDFGSFKEALNKKEVGKENESMNFSISFNMYRRDLNRIGRYLINDKNDKNEKLETMISFNIKKDYINNVNINIGKNNIEINFKNKITVDYIVINGTNIADEKIKGYKSGHIRGILPDLVVFNEEDKISNSIEEYFVELICNRVKEKCNIDYYENFVGEFIEQFIEKINIGSILNMETINAVDYTENNSDLIQEIVELIKSDHIIQNYILGSKLERILYLCNMYLEEKFINVKYIAPVRANAERYYRVQGLAINEIDSRGENIAMLLYNLSDKNKKDFSSWVRENFGFGISTYSEGGHVSINVQHKDTGEPINLVDTGFGYSQILPIIVQLWKITKERNLRSRYMLHNREIHILVIEQPELHLHPAMQADLVDAFVKVLNLAKQHKIDLRILIETHSETIVNRVGYLIDEKRFGCSEELVNLLIFNKVDEYESCIIKSGYDKNGYLEQWPIGFFNAGE